MTTRSSINVKPRSRAGEDVRFIRIILAGNRGVLKCLKGSVQQRRLPFSVNEERRVRIWKKHVVAVKSTDQAARCAMSQKIATDAWRRDISFANYAVQGGPRGWAERKVTVATEADSNVIVSTTTSDSIVNPTTATQEGA